jgi:SAM-dependent methyltransferase
MDKDFDCPVCETRAWRKLHAIHYNASDHLVPESSRVRVYAAKLARRAQSYLSGSPPTNVLKATVLDGYCRRRRRVLFEQWFPGAEEVVLQLLGCEACGFVAFSPRPSEADVAAKYGFLGDDEGNLGGEDTRDNSAMESDRRRASALLAWTHPYVTKEAAVLDFGGGNGKLLRPFVERGFRCDLVDYNRRPIAGVQWIAEALSAVPKAHAYGLIVASHVLEHVASPRPVVDGLRALLRDDGILYAEVPLEIRGGVWIAEDPVTHINFFTPSSFLHLFLSNGFRIIRTETGAARYGGKRGHVIRVLCSPTARADSVAPTSDLAGYLYPGVLDRILALWRSLRA